MESQVSSAQSNTQKTSVKSTWFNASWIAAISAIFVGLSALGVSIYQSYLMHQQQRMSVWPMLSPLHSDIDGGYVYSVQNDGVGPAIIRFVDIRLDNKPIEDWGDLFTELGLNKESIGPYSTLSNRVIAAGARIDAIRLSNLAAGAKYRENFNRIQIEICYCSIYQDCYQYSTARSPTTEFIASCPAYAQQTFSN